MPSCGSTKRVPNPVRRNGLAERIAADPPNPFPDSGTVDIAVGNLLHLGPWIARFHSARDGLGAAGRLVHEIGPALIRLAERKRAIEIDVIPMQNGAEVDENQIALLNLALRRRAVVGARTRTAADHRADARILAAIAHG